jgi:hypothetical protein
MRRAGHEKKPVETRIMQRSLRLLKDPGFQYRLLLSQAVSLLAFAVSLFGVIEYSFDFADEFRRKVFIYTSLIILTGMEFLISAIFVINYTNRLFRPIHRVKSYFVKILMREKFPEFELSFTRAEHFHDLPPVINKAIKKLKKDGEEPPSEADAA